VIARTCMIICVCFVFKKTPPIHFNKKRKTTFPDSCNRSINPISE
jgi:hypothetical protein